MFGLVATAKHRQQQGLPQVLPPRPARRRPRLVPRQSADGYLSIHASTSTFNHLRVAAPGPTTAPEAAGRPWLTRLQPSRLPAACSDMPGRCRQRVQGIGRAAGAAGGWQRPLSLSRRRRRTRPLCRHCSARRPWVPGPRLQPRMWPASGPCCAPRLIQPTM